MAKVCIISEEEYVQLDIIEDILNQIACTVIDVADEDEMSRNQAKTYAELLSHWTSKAADTLGSILTEGYDREKHDLKDFQMSK